MKTLLVLRHAKSSWKHQGLTDHERPLNQRGKKEAPRVCEYLRAMGYVPDVIVSSTAQRAIDTARAVADACGLKPEQIIEEPQLYNADRELKIVNQFPDRY